MNKEQLELIGDNHISSNVETPLVKNAFVKSDLEKIESIQKYFTKIMEELGLDLVAFLYILFSQLIRY